jgi:hypothetical protein
MRFFLLLGTLAITAACSLDYKPMCEQQYHSKGDAAVADCKARLLGYKNDRELASLTRNPDRVQPISDLHIERSIRERDMLCENDSDCRNHIKK